MRLADALLYRTAKSLDTRETAEKYAFSMAGSSRLIGPQGIGQLNVAEHAASPTVVDTTKPGVTVDSGNNRFVATGVDFTEANSGTTVREFDFTIHMQPVGEDYVSTTYVQFSISPSAGLTFEALTPVQVHLADGADQPPISVTWRGTYAAAPTTAQHFTVTAYSSHRTVGIGGYTCVYALPGIETDAYAYTYQSTGAHTFNPDDADFHLTAHVDHIYPDNPPGYHPQTPGLVLDGRNGVLNTNGVDFTEDNAGTTTREYLITVKLTPSTERNYAPTEHILLRVNAHGHWQGVAPAGWYDQYQKLTFHGGSQEPFVRTFRIQLTQAPRNGHQDYVQVSIGQSPQRSPHPIKFDSWSITVGLPYDGRFATQGYRVTQATGRVPLPGFDNSDFPWMATLALNGDNAEGDTRDREEADRAEVVSDGYGALTGKRVLVAQRDLRQVKFRFASQIEPTYDGTIHLYVVGWAPDVIAPRVVGIVALAPHAYDTTVAVEGIIEGETFAIFSSDHIDPSSGILTYATLGNPLLTWDPALAPQAPNPHLIAQGIVDTWVMELIGNQKTADEIPLAGVPHPTSWLAVRTYSNGVISCVPWGMDDRLPTSGGQPAGATPVLSPFSMRTESSTGTIVHNREVQIWRDGQTYKMRFYNTGSRETDLYLDRIEIDYLA